MEVKVTIAFDDASLDVLSELHKVINHFNINFAKPELEKKEETKKIETLQVTKHVETVTNEEISNEAETKPEVKEEKKKKEPKKKAVTIENVRAALNAKAKKDGFDKAIEIIKDLGAENVNELKAEFYEKCIELCQA